MLYYTPWETILEMIIAADVVLTEAVLVAETIIGVVVVVEKDKCIKQYVQIAEKHAKFPLGQPIPNQFIVVNVSRKWVEEEEVKK